MPVIAITGSPGTGKTTLSNQLPKERYDQYTVEQIATELGCIEHLDGDNVVTTELLTKWKYAGNKIAIIEGHLSHHCKVDAVLLLRCHPIELNSRLQSRDAYGAKKIQQNIEWEMIAGIWSELVENSPNLPILELDMTAPLDGIESIELFISDHDERKTVQESIPLAIDWLSGDNVSESI
jgi:adenylate kinase